MSNRKEDNNQQQQVHEPTKDEIINTQAGIIQSLRNQFAETKEELQMIKTAVLQGNLQAAIAAAHYKQAQQNEEIRKRNDEYNRARQEEIEAHRQQVYDNLRTKVLKENPAWEKNLTKQRYKITKERDYLLSKTEEFFDLEEDKARKYCSYKHRLEESAVRYLIGEVVSTNSLGQKKFEGYECTYCHSQRDNLEQMELHIFSEGNTHYNAVMQEIKDEATIDMGNANTEFLGLVESGIQAIRNREQRTILAKAQEAEQKDKDTLPYVKR